MKEHKIADASGKNSLTVLEYKGRLYPTFPEDAIRGVETFKARSDDVIVCAYPKSGTHWIWEMVRCLMAGTTDLPVAEKDDGMLEFVVPEELEKIPSPRILNTHAHFDCLSPDIFTSGCKVIYATRDPRDTAVSYYNHHLKLEEFYFYEGEWKDYLPLFLQGKVDYDSWFEYTKGWERGLEEHPELPTHVTSYENLQQDVIAEIQKLAEFLKVKADRDFIIKIAEKCSFNQMRQAKSHFDGFKDGQSIMYRKGKSGDWKNWFTVAQSEQFNEIFEKEMKGTQAYQLYSHSHQKSPNFQAPDANMNDIK